MTPRSRALRLARRFYGPRVSVGRWPSSQGVCVGVLGPDGDEAYAVAKTYGGAMRALIARLTRLLRTRTTRDLRALAQEESAKDVAKYPRGTVSRSVRNGGV